MQVLRFPLVKVTIAFVLGLLIARYFYVNIENMLIAAVFLVVVLVIFIIISTSNFNSKVYLGILISLVSMIVGAVTFSLHLGVNNANHYINCDYVFQKPSFIAVTLREQLKYSEKNFRFVCDVNQVDSVKTVGKIILNITRDSIPMTFYIGQTIYLKSKIQPHLPPKNPDQFDYGNYLLNKNIYGQIYANQREILLEPIPNKTLWYFTNKIRSRIVQNLERSKLDNRELAVLSALILGQRQEIDPQIIKDYQYAGAVHILSVSGLHVGLIIIFINNVLRFIPQSKSVILLKLVLTLFCLWSFAILASLSPSVVRAVTMFSFLAIGMSFKRSTNVFHTLIVSILLILLIQPSFLFDVGFQLSYIALFSILWLQPIFAKIWRPKNKIIQYFWDIVTVSFAAQIGSFPISVYYFHQFPGLFFITNLIIIPLLSVVMALGIIAMVIAVFGTVPSVIINAVEFCLRSMNYCIHYVASFEKFVLHNIPISSYMLVSLYVLIIFFFVYAQKQTFKNLTFVLYAILSCNLSYYISKYESKHSKFLVFQQRNNSIFLEIFDGKLQVNSTKTLQKWDEIAIQSFATANYLERGNNQSSSNYYYINSKRIAVVDNSAVYNSSANADVLLLIQSPKLNLQRLIDQTQPRIIVADGTNYPYLIRIWEATCFEAKIPFHNTSEKGFYEIR